MFSFLYHIHRIFCCANRLFSFLKHIRWIFCCTNCLFSFLHYIKGVNRTTNRTFYFTNSLVFRFFSNWFKCIPNNSLKFNLMQPCLMNLIILCHVWNIICSFTNNFSTHSICFYNLTYIPNLSCEISITHLFIDIHFTHVFFFTNAHTLTNIFIQLLSIFEIRWNTLFERIKVTIHSSFSHLAGTHALKTFSIRITFTSRYNFYVVKSIVTMLRLNTIILI